VNAYELAFILGKQAAVVGRKRMTAAEAERVALRWMGGIPSENRGIWLDVDNETRDALIKEWGRGNAA